MSSTAFLVYAIIMFEDFCEDMESSKFAENLPMFAESWLAIKKSAEDRGHFGDCTNQPNVCEKCLIEDMEQRVIDASIALELAMKDL